MARFSSKAFVAFAIAAMLATAHGHGGEHAKGGKPTGVGNAGHVDAWHGTGSDHQDNNQPGDTAADRHNFGDATAGNSGSNPVVG